MNDIRELAGSLNPVGKSEATIESLKTHADTYRLKALREEDLVKERFYKSVSEPSKLKADYIRLENNMKPEHQEANRIIEEVRNNDLTRFERFKKCAKENMVGVSALVISVAGIIGARKAISTGARATGKFAKALYNLGKKLGPLLAPLLNIIAQAISWGAKGLA